MSSGSSFVSLTVFGKCLASTVPISLTASTQRITELLILKMRPHSFHDALPEFIAAFFMNRVVPNNRKFMNTRRDKNEHRIALARLVHTEPMKLPLCSLEGITL